MIFDNFYRIWDLLAFGILGFLPFIVMIWYVKIIQCRNKVREALGSIDVHLKQRLDIIPNILKMAQKFMAHERSLLEEITNLRMQAVGLGGTADSNGLGERLAAESQISVKMSGLLAQVENYPELKSDATMIQAMTTFNEIESRIAASRRFFNAAATSLNNAVEIFPGTLIAKLAGVSSVSYFAAESEARKSIDVSDYLTEPAR